jgi:hypothetical protein
MMTIIIANIKRTCSILMRTGGSGDEVGIGVIVVVGVPVGEGVGDSGGEVGWEVGVGVEVDS